MIKRTFLLIAMCANVFILTLLSGFVPQNEGNFIRLPISTGVAVLGQEDMPEALLYEENVIVRGTITKERRRMDDEHSSLVKGKTSKKQWIYFLKDGIHLQTDHGMRNVQKVVLSQAATSSVTQLILLDDALPNAYLANAALATMQPEQYGETMTLDGRPARWNFDKNTPSVAPALMDNDQISLDPLCDLTRPSLDTLHKALVTRSFVPRDNEGTLARARRFQSLINAEAKKYGIPASLLFAIIQTESNFSPTLISSQSAMGLMQVLPSTAGGEVHRFLHGTSAHIGYKELSQPQLNIRFGTAYVHLLLTRYFGGIHNPLSRQYCTLAAYNMGPGRLISFFGPGRQNAIDNINALSSKEVYRRLTQVLHIAETRNYVARVTHRQSQFEGLAGSN